MGKLSTLGKYGNILEQEKGKRERRKIRKSLRDERGKVDEREGEKGKGKEKRRKER